MYYQNYSIDLNQCNSATAFGNASEKASRQHADERIERRQDYMASLSPVERQLVKLNSELQQQNQYFSERIQLLKEENEQQEKQLKADKRTGWIQFGVSTGLAVAALIVSIIALCV